MTEREILIANTKTQKKCKITTDASTLGELKAALDAQGIDYEGMTFTEGLSNTQLLDDSSQLPTNVKYKGQVTNSLFILLTNTKKKIESGAEEDRKNAYRVIQDNELQEEVKEEFGRNYTLVRTSDLWNFIHDTLDDDTVEDSMYDEEDGIGIDDEDEEYGEEEEDAPTYNFTSTDVVNAVYDLIKTLVKVGQLNVEDMSSLLELMKELTDRMMEEADDSVEVGGITFSKEDLNEMMAKA